MSLFSCHRITSSLLTFINSLLFSVTLVTLLLGSHFIFLLLSLIAGLSIYSNSVVRVFSPDVRCTVRRLEGGRTWYLVRVRTKGVSGCLCGQTEDHIGTFLSLQQDVVTTTRTRQVIDTPNGSMRTSTFGVSPRS